MILAILLIVFICCIPSVIVYYVLNRHLAAKGNRHGDLFSILAFIGTFCLAVISLYLIVINLEWGR